MSFCSVADAAALWGYGLLLGRRQSGNRRENTRRVGWAPPLGECSADGPTEDEMPAGEMFNRLIVNVLS